MGTCRCVVDRWSRSVIEEEEGKGSKIIAVSSPKARQPIRT